MTKTSVFLLRISPQDKQVLRGLALATRMPMSEVVRRSVLQASINTLRNA